MKTKKTLNRRNFISLTIAGSSALLFPFNVKAQQKLRVRYSINSPDPVAKQNVENLKEAIRIMKNLPESKYYSWIAQARIHKDFCPHYSSIFLPWHRAYIFYFEEICRKLLRENSVKGWNEFALPYWDWTTFPQMPPIFDTGSLQNDTNPLTLGWVKAPFTYARKNNSNSSANQAKVGRNKIKEFFGKRFEGIVFSGGTGQLESGPHNYIHTEFIQGNMESWVTAALDPIFWVHHANVDRLWLNWTRINIKRTPSPNCRNNCISRNPERIQNWLLSKVDGFYNVNGNLVSHQVCELLDTFDSNIFNGGYHYDDNSTPIKFGDCIIMSKNKQSGFFIKGNVGKNKIAKTNEPVTIKVSDYTKIPRTLSNSLKTFLDKKKSTTLSSKTLSSDPALLMTIEVEKPVNPRLSVNVFISEKENLTTPSVDSPEYVATFSFFESIGAIHQHNNADMDMNDESRKFTFDVTDTILELSKSKEFTLKEAKISIYPISLSMEKDMNSGVRLISFEFDLID